MSEKILTLIDRVGSNAYAVVETSEDGKTANVEVTAAQASKLQSLLGEKAVKMVGLRGSHVVIRVDVAALEKAAEERSRVSRGSATEVEIASRVVYDIAIKSEGAANEVTAAWWSSGEMSGGITVNGVEYEIAPGMAQDFYTAPEGDTEWNPERTVYVVDLPVADDEPLTLVSYGVTNLIRRVCARNERIG